jgi:DNA invertase Pin-like site-specific DNA recombinase
MQGPKLVGLVRVSTDKQEDSGLGLSAQQAAIEAYRQMVSGQVLKTYVEVESGMHDDVDSRPQLRAAAAHASFARARLVIAKIDRLVRSTVVMAYLKKTGVQFVACDNPHANELTIDILVAVAADEGRRISTRTKDALRAYRENRRVSRRIRALHPEGVPPAIVEATAGKLGASLPQCRNLTAEARARGARAAGLAHRKRAAEAYGHLVPTMLELQSAGKSLAEIAAVLNAEGHQTRRGKAWNKHQVKRVLDRARTTAAAVELPDRVATRRTA